MPIDVRPHGYFLWRNPRSLLVHQGNDKGTQYRSAIFYHDDTQREIAERSKAAADASGDWSDPIVTEVTAADTFYPAENYHQNYYNTNPGQGYCAYVITPKILNLKRRQQIHDVCTSLPYDK